ncbi:MAG: hypothetical protein KatS3mg029_0364 [Saprospiraceae bacterium]|nr:MAG: hypothetical protein KatS3mg029_0364 [Saprospiraceae bacterium]
MRQGRKEKVREAACGGFGVLRASKCLWGASREGNAHLADQARLPFSAPGCAGRGPFPTFSVYSISNPGLSLRLE